MWTEHVVTSCSRSLPDLELRSRGNEISDEEMKLPGVFIELGFFSKLCTMQKRFRIFYYRLSSSTLRHVRYQQHL